MTVRQNVQKRWRPQRLDWATLDQRRPTEPLRTFIRHGQPTSHGGIVNPPAAAFDIFANEHKVMERPPKKDGRPGHRGDFRKVAANARQPHAETVTQQAQRGQRQTRRMRIFRGEIA